MTNASDTSVTESSACADIDVTEPLVQQCNLSPCKVYTWNVGEWGPCNATCGGMPIPLANCSVDMLAAVVMLATSGPCCVYLCIFGKCERLGVLHFTGEAV